MICQQGVVQAIHDGRARIRFQPGTTCQTCARGEGCGMGLLAGLLRRRPIDLSIPADQRWSVGDRVAVALESRDLTRLALVVYGAPLVAFLAGVALCALVLPSGPSADLGGLALGVAGAVAVSGWLGRRTRPPARVRRIPHHKEAEQ